MKEDHLPRSEHELTLVPVLTEVRRARRFAHYVLRERQIPEDRIEAAELLVSELVTNAVKTTSTMKLRPPRRMPNDHFWVIRLRLSLLACSIIIEVQDGSDKPPVRQEQSLDSEEGRGLAVVEWMSSQWNYFRLSSGGKVVWCELLIPQLAAADEVVALPRPLPRRIRSGRPASPVVVMKDPELLRRVRDGLVALDADEEAAQ
jgi:hypothetical protein